MRNPQFLALAVFAIFLSMLNAINAQEVVSFKRKDHANSIEHIISHFGADLPDDCSRSSRIKLSTAEIATYREISRLQKRKIRKALGIRITVPEVNVDRPPTSDEPMYICKGKICPCSSIQGSNEYYFTYNPPGENNTRKKAMAGSSSNKQYKMTLVFRDQTEKTIPTQTASRKRNSFQLFELNMDTLAPSGVPSRLRIEEIRPSGEKRTFCFYVRYVRQHAESRTQHGGLTISNTPL